MLYSISQSVQSFSLIWLFATLWTAACQASMSITNSWNLLKLMSIESVMPSNYLILLSPSSAFSLSQHQGLFKWVSSLIRWTKYWRFSFNISSSSEYSGLISFRMDWLDLLTVQWTLKSFLQYHSSKASILEHSDLFIVQLSHPYMATGKIIALTRWTLVGKVMSLLFSVLYTYIPSLVNLPPTHHPPPGHHSTELSVLCCTAASDWLSILHVVVDTCQSYSPISSHPLFPAPTQVLYICISIPVLWIG